MTNFAVYIFALLYDVLFSRQHES